MGRPMKRLILALALFCAAPAFADVQNFQVTIGASGNTRVTPGNADFQCRWVMFQNNATHNMRIGDNTTSGTRGMQLQPNAWFFVPVSPVAPFTETLSRWYVAGTAGDVLDITCEA